jgi:hypothetical protein
MKKIYKELQKISKNMQESTSTNSTYFYLNTIKIRVSDHHNISQNYHLNLIILKNNYLVIPNYGNYKKYLYFTNIKEVINFIKNYDLAYTILIGHPSKATNYEVGKINEIKEMHGILKPKPLELLTSETQIVNVQPQTEEVTPENYENLYKRKIKDFTCNYNPEILEVTENYLKASKSIDDLYKRIDFLNSMQNLNKGQRVSMIKNLMQL